MQRRKEAYAEHAPRPAPAVYLDSGSDRLVPAYELVLRRNNHKDRVQYRHTDEARVGDVVYIDRIPWVVVSKEPPFGLRRIERVICVPRTVRSLR